MLPIGFTLFPSTSNTSGQLRAKKKHHHHGQSRLMILLFRPPTKPLCNLIPFVNNTTEKKKFLTKPLNIKSLSLFSNRLSTKN